METKHYTLMQLTPYLSKIQWENPNHSMGQMALHHYDCSNPMITIWDNEEIYCLTCKKTARLSVEGIIRWNMEDSRIIPADNGKSELEVEQ